MGKANPRFQVQKKASPIKKVGGHGWAENSIVKGKGGKFVSNKTKKNITQQLKQLKKTVKEVKESKKETETDLDNTLRETENED